MEDDAERLLTGFLPSEWIVRRIEKDYGIDFEIEIVDQEDVTGNRFWVQLKSCDSPLVQHSGSNKVRPHVVYPMKTKDLCYAQSCPFPLLLMVADLKTREIYWSPLRNEIQSGLNSDRPEWQEQDSASIRLPLENTLSREKASNYPKLRWFALEPARLSALSLVMHYYHHFDAVVAPYLDPNILDEGPHGVETLCANLLQTKRTIEMAISIDVLFGSDSIEGNFAASALSTAACLRRAAKAIGDVLETYKKGLQPEWDHLADEVYPMTHTGEAAKWDTAERTGYQCWMFLQAVIRAIKLLSTTNSQYHEGKSRFTSVDPVRLNDGR